MIQRQLFTEGLPYAKRRGATMTLLVALLPMMLVLAAFAINVAHYESAKTDIQIVTDAAARAAAREYLLTEDKNLALAAAQELATRNPIGSYVVPFEMSDLEFGIGVRSGPGTPYVFNNTGGGNAIRITTNTLSSGRSGVSPVFPFFGVNKIQPKLSATSTQGVIDIALVVDRSGSMAYSSSEPAVFPPAPSSAPADWEFGNPVPPNARWLDLIGAVQVFVNEMNSSPTDEKASLTVYDDNSIVLQNLSHNYAPIVNELHNISSAFDSGGTNIGGGMLTGKSTLSSFTHGRTEATKVIILMTDGVHNIGTSPDSAANSIKNAGVTLYTVTFSDEADQAKMQSVAEQCGGQHFHAVNAAQLQDAFRDIARGLPSLLTE